MSDDLFATNIQNINITIDSLKRMELLELGRKGPYMRYVTFPIGETDERERLLREAHHQPEAVSDVPVDSGESVDSTAPNGR